MKSGSNTIKIEYQPYELEMRHVFTLSNISRKTTPSVLVAMSFEGITGYGEACIPRHFGETPETVSRFLDGLNMSGFSSPLHTEAILDYVKNSSAGNFAAKASVDIALNDLAGKIRGIPWHKYMDIDHLDTPYTSYTLGIDSPAATGEKLTEALPFSIIKVKLGSDADRDTINHIRNLTDKPLIADVNQGWTDKYKALDMIGWLAEKGVIMIEQPMPAGLVDEIGWLSQKSPLPVFADESFHTIDDIPAVKDIYHGINIKLMKCGGMLSGYEIIREARKNGLSVMIGCMTETSCAISAAAQLSPLCDMADLDGNLLVKNDPFRGMTLREGKIVLNDKPGIGVELNDFPGRHI